MSNGTIIAILSRCLVLTTASMIRHLINYSVTHYWRPLFFAMEMVTAVLVLFLVLLTLVG